MKIYDFVVKDMEGKDVSLKDYEGKVLLIVNTATKCGFTPQYEGLEALAQKYKDKDFEILDFPCNQFLEQAPEDNEGIRSFCVANFGLSYPQFSKLEVNGPNADPLFKYLKEEKPVDKDSPKLPGLLEKLKELGQEREGSDIKWNFTKFLIDKEGNVVERYGPVVEPQELEEAIDKLLE